MIEVSDEMKEIFITTAKQLKSHERRAYMAKTVRALGRGGLTYALQELGWSRHSITKGMKEVDSGFICYDNFQARGRKPAEEHLPNLLDDIAEIVDSQSQTDPRFKHNRLYCQMSAERVREELMKQKNYKDSELPVARIIRNKLNQLGYILRRVQKTKPKKKSRKRTPSSID